MTEVAAVVVTRLVSPAELVGRRQTMSLIRQVRALAHEARLSNPELAAYRLDDVGLRRVAGDAGGVTGGLEINLYFVRSPGSP